MEYVSLLTVKKELTPAIAISMFIPWTKKNGWPEVMIHGQPCWSLSGYESFLRQHDPMLSENSPARKRPFSSTKEHPLQITEKNPGPSKKPNPPKVDPKLTGLAKVQAVVARYCAATVPDRNKCKAPEFSDWHAKLKQAAPTFSESYIEKVIEFCHSVRNFVQKLRMVQVSFLFNTDSVSIIADDAKASTLGSVYYKGIRDHGDGHQNIDFETYCMRVGGNMVEQLDCLRLGTSWTIKPKEAAALSLEDPCSDWHKQLTTNGPPLMSVDSHSKVINLCQRINNELLRRVPICTFRFLKDRFCVDCGGHHDLVEVSYAVAIAKRGSEITDFCMKTVALVVQRIDAVKRSEDPKDIDAKDWFQQLNNLRTGHMTTDLYLREKVLGVCSRVYRRLATAGIGCKVAFLHNSINFDRENGQALTSVPYSAIKSCPATDRDIDALCASLIDRAFKCYEALTGKYPLGISKTIDPAGQRVDEFRLRTSWIEQFNSIPECSIRRETFQQLKVLDVCMRVYQRLSAMTVGCQFTFGPAAFRIDKGTKYLMTTCSYMRVTQCPDTPRSIDVLVDNIVSDALEGFHQLTRQG